MDMKFVGKFNHNYDIRYFNGGFVVTGCSISWNNNGVNHQIYSWWDALEMLDCEGMTFREYRVYMEELDYRLYDICIVNVNNTTIAVTYGPDSRGYHVTSFWLWDGICNKWASVTETEFCLINIAAGSQKQDV
jgi:hypothetical protein